MTCRRGVLKVLLGLAIAGAAHAPSSAAEAPLPVVASFSILGDFVRQVGGDRVAVTTLVGPDGDGHSFQPSPADARAVAAARIVFVNGLGFEGWMPRLVQAAGGSPMVVETSRGIAPRSMEEDGAAATDPHVWQDVGNARRMVGAVRDALDAADP